MRRLAPLVFACLITLLGSSFATDANSQLSKLWWRTSLVKRTPASRTLAEILTVESGLTFVSYEELAASSSMNVFGFYHSARHRKLRLERFGKQVSYAPARKGIYFVAQATGSELFDHAVYRVRTGFGRHMAWERVRGKREGHDVIAEHLEFEESPWPVTLLSDDPDGDHFYWDVVVGGGETAFPLEAADLVSAEASLQVRLRGATDGLHQVDVELNDVTVGSVELSDDARAEPVFELPLGLLQASNTLRLRGQSSSASVVFIDSFAIDYRRTLPSEGQVDFVSEPGGYDIPRHRWVFDMTHPNHPTRVWSHRPLAFDEATPLLVASRSDAHRPAEVRPARRASLPRRGELLIITPESMAHAAERLAEHRRDGGLSASVAKLEDIYDVFAHGHADPYAMQRFVAHALSSFVVPPRYLLLAGDAHIDNFDRQGFGRPVLPTVLTDTPFGLYAADHRFADVDGDALPELSVGRVGARDAAELEAFVTKVIAYEATSSAGFREHAAFVSDNTDAAGDFTTDNDLIKDRFPSTWATSRMSIEETSGPEVRDELLSTIEEGVGLINYIGHGGMDRLANEGIIKLSDLDTLGNEGRPFILASLSCIVNRHELATFQGLGESLVTKSNGGAIAVWSPTVLSYNSQSQVMNPVFVDEYLGASEETRLGDIMSVVYDVYTSGDHYDWLLSAYSLQGDPSMFVR